MKKKILVSTLIACLVSIGCLDDIARVDVCDSSYGTGAVLAADAAATPSAGASPSIAPGASPSAASLEDYTDRLKMNPGMTILFPVQDGCDRNGRAVPNYTMVVEIEPKSADCAFSYKWTMAGLNASGVRAVDQKSKLASRKISLFYKSGESCALMGYASAIRVSDAMYRDLKNGVSSPIELDGPFTQSTRHAVSVPLPRNISRVGEENLPMQVDEKKVTVRCLKAVGDNPPGAFGPFPKGGWTYWILDNADFPMIVKGSGPFSWENPIVNSNGNLGGGPSSPAGINEGKRIVKELKKNGIASTTAILFDFDSDKLKPSAKPILNEVANYLKTTPAIKIAVQGHCDNVGGSDYNLNLSRRRAKSVSQFLVDQGIGGDRLKSEGYGYNRPVASNKTAAGRAKNRRVVFKVI